MLRRALCLLLSFAVAPTAAADAKSVFAKAAPSIVVVIAQDGSGEEIAQGSGVVVGEGMAITNCHVIEHAARVRIRQAADSQAAQSYLMDGEVAARDEEQDLCLLYAPDLAKPPVAQAATIGAAKGLVIGENVYAIGAPHGLELSLSRGIVAQLRGVKGKPPVVQTDAAISPGSSGGGLFNDKGELVGITTYKRKDGENLNFAMPAEEIPLLIQDVRREQECIKNPQYQCALALAKQTWQRIDDTDDRDWALGFISIAQANSGDINGAKQSTQKINNVNARARALWYITGAQIESGDIAGAEQTAHEIVPVLYRARAFDTVAFAQNKAGDTNAAKRNMDYALQTARQVENFDFDRDGVLRDIVATQTILGDISGAKQTARQIEDGDSRDDALLNIAVAQAKTGDITTARQTVRDIGNAEHRNWALFNIVEVQAQSGDISGARQIAQQFDDFYFHVRSSLSIAAARRKAGDINDSKRIFDNALQTARKIDDIFFRSGALRHIAIAQADAGNISGAKNTFDYALQTARHIDDGDRFFFGRPSNRASMLRSIAVARAESGDADGAKRTLDYALQDAQQSYYFTLAVQLHEIASAQSQTGDFTAAMKTARLISTARGKTEAFANIAIFLATQ